MTGNEHAHHRCSLRTLLTNIPAQQNIFFPVRRVLVSVR
ncbi:hypothetical protein G893_04248, partial [Escherichia coli KOEGE 71 (186a)]